MIFDFKYLQNKNLLTQHYNSRVQEEEFQKSIVKPRQFQMRFIALLTTLIYFAYVFLDFYLIGDGMLKTTVLFHASMVGILALSALNISKKWGLYLLYISPIYASVSSSFLIVNGLEFYLGDIHIIFLWALVVVGFRFFEASIIALVMLGLHISIFLLLPNIFTFEVLVNHSFLTLVSLILGLMAAYIIELYTRINYETTTALSSSNKNIQDSIAYASLIQSALIPDKSSFKNHFQEYFVIWSPKETIGGDIYLFEELRDKDECLLMVIDCTGHGVPGAFVTMLVKAIESQIIAYINNSDEVVSPARYLNIFNKKIKKLLKQYTGNSASNAGFDGGIIYYNKKEKILKYAGANTPLFYIDSSGEIKMIKGDRYSVGYKKCAVDYEYTEHTIDVTNNMQFYLTTDGFIDQNGGEKSFPFGKTRFKRLIEKSQTKCMQEQESMFLKTLSNYECADERNDDITVIAFKI